MGPERWVKSGFSYSFWTLGLARTESQSNLDCNLKKKITIFYDILLYNFLRFFHVFFFIFHDFFTVFLIFHDFFPDFFTIFFAILPWFFFPIFAMICFTIFFMICFTIFTTIFFSWFFSSKKDLLNFYWIVHDFLQVKFVKIKDFVLPFF